MTPLPGRAAVVGHVEWADLLVVERLPRPGEILETSECGAVAAGSGAVAAVQLAKLCGESTFFTALADDELGRRAARELAEADVAVHAARRPPPQRRALVHLDADGERTITICGERIVARGDDALPWAELDGVDAVYVTGGDTGALTAARRAKQLVVTPRAGAALRGSGVPVDVLIHSGNDEGERLAPGQLDPPPRMVVTTLGSDGGRWSGEAGTGTWKPAPLPGPVVDAYGAGDSFAAGVTAGIAAGLPIGEAVALGARCGAACMTGRGPYAGQLDLR